MQKKIRTRMIQVIAIALMISYAVTIFLSIGGSRASLRKISGTSRNT